MGIRKGLQDRPRLLEQAFRFHFWLFMRIRGLLAWVGFDRVDRWIHVPEEVGKKMLFDCRMCGQCVLHSTGMTCPMTCPKNLRNGPCGGVRADGGCEVKPEMRCIWVEAFERSQKMTVYGDEFKMIQPPLNQRLEGSSSWVTLLAGRTDPPAGWSSSEDSREE